MVVKMHRGHTFIPLFWREFKNNLSNLIAVAHHVLNPTIYVLLFGVALSSNFNYTNFLGKEISYMSFLIPGFIAMQTFVVFTMTFSLIRLDMVTNMIMVIISSKASMRSYVFAKFLFNLTITHIVSFYICVLGFLFSGYIPNDFFGLLLLFYSVTIGVAFWFSLGFVLGVYIRSEDIRDIVFALLSLPISFGSTVFYPLDNVPIWLKLIGGINPLTFIANIARQGYLNVYSSNIAVDLLALLTYSLIFMALALFVSKRLVIK